VAAGKVKISDHGYDELAADGILAGEVIAGVAGTMMVEDYPEYYKGASVSVLQGDAAGHPIHAVGRIAKGTDEPVVLITAYRPDVERWTADFRRRNRRIIAGTSNTCMKASTWPRSKSSCWTPMRAGGLISPSMTLISWIACALLFEKTTLPRP
jgi:hypothetical protein